MILTFNSGVGCRIVGTAGRLCRIGSVKFYCISNTPCCFFFEGDLLVRVYVEKVLVYFPCLYCLAGTCHFSDGKEYTGTWKDGLPHGNGSFSTHLFCVRFSHWLCIAVNGKVLPF